MSAVLAVHDTGSLTLMFPLPLVVDPCDERIITEPLFNALPSVAPEISPDGEPEVTVPAAVAAMVKSDGSISQFPLLPLSAAVVMLAVSATFT